MNKSLFPISRRNPQRSLSRRTTGFTLVELLIVVGIIATLGAIAVPNFMEAQTRSKISRSRSELRAVATGLETYRVEFNAYPVVGNPSMPGSWDLSVPYLKRLTVLTTPIAYISRIPRDVFAARDNSELLGPEYCYAPGNLYHGAATRYSGQAFRKTIYSISGRGPDKKIDVGSYCLSHPEAYRSQLAVRGAYDATNGTVSQGDIIQLNCGRL